MDKRSAVIKDAHKTWSFQANLLALASTVVAVVQMSLPAWETAIPTQWYVIATALTITVSNTLKFFKQHKLEVQREKVSAQRNRRPGDLAVDGNGPSGSSKAGEREDEGSA